MSSPAPRQIVDPLEAHTLDATQGRRSMGAFLVSGMLVSFLGAILPAWRYHLWADFREVGSYFLSLNLGFLLSAGAAHFLMPRKGVKFMLVLASGVACAGFLCLALCSSLPISAIWRLPAVLAIGVSAGFLNAGLFQTISPLYRHDRAATLNVAGAMFGLGCLITALLVAGTYFVYNVPSILILFALLPGFYAGIWAKAKIPQDPVMHQLPITQVMRDFRNPGAILFTLVLFFQFGNEWSMAGWLPLFLIRRLGISPATSLLMLALFWAALLVGRIVSQVVLKRMNHGLLMLVSIVSALLGTIVLASTNNGFGAVMGILFVGAGFASIYPLVVEKIAKRFPYYHPGFYNGIFSLGITGGLLAPWTLGYIPQPRAIRPVMILPILGTFMRSMLIPPLFSL